MEWPAAAAARLGLVPIAEPVAAAASNEVAEARCLVFGHHHVTAASRSSRPADAPAAAADTD